VRQPNRRASSFVEKDLVWKYFQE
jgi:hypothetical protein